MEPTTVITTVNIASSILHLCGPKGYSIRQLFKIQTELLLKISQQLLVIQKGIETILLSLDEIQKAIQELPSRTAIEIYESELRGINLSYQEFANGYMLERKKKGIIEAQKVYEPLFDRLIEKLVFSRNNLFSYNSPMHIPLVSSIMHIEILSSVMASRPKSQIISALQAYLAWFDQHTNTNNLKSLPKRIEGLRGKRFEIRKIGAEFYCNCNCLIDVGQEGGERGGGAWGTLIRRLGKYIENDVLETQALTEIQPLIDSKFLKDSDLPRKLDFVGERNEVKLVHAKVSDTNIVMTSNPAVVPESAVTGTLTLPNCTDRELSVELQATEISKQLESSGFSLILLCSLLATTNQSMAAISKFIKDPILNQ